MKTRILTAALGASLFTTPGSVPRAVAQSQEQISNSYKTTWKGVATVRTLRRKSKARTLLVAYPVFAGSRRVAQVAGSTLKKDAVRHFNAFEKSSRTPTGIGLPYEFEMKPFLVMNHPRLISVRFTSYSFEGGAHGNYDLKGYVFGTPQGATTPRQLQLADFFTDGQVASKRVNDLLMNKLRATKGTDREATWVLDGSVKWVDARLRENFVAEPDGLRWHFPPYAMGTFANGDYEMKISARELGPKFRASLLR